MNASTTLVVVLSPNVPAAGVVGLVAVVQEGNTTVAKLGVSAH